jgi:hypothetical protein
MKSRDTVFLLQQAIRAKEAERDEKLIALKGQFKAAMDSLKPINLLKETFSGGQEAAVDTAIGITSGYIVKKAIAGSSQNPLIRILASVIGAGAGNLAAKHAGGIKAMGAYLFKALSSKVSPEPAKT